MFNAHHAELIDDDLVDDSQVGLPVTYRVKDDAAAVFLPVAQCE